MGGGEPPGWGVGLQQSPFSLKSHLLSPTEVSPQINGLPGKSDSGLKGKPLTREVLARRASHVGSPSHKSQDPKKMQKVVLDGEQLDSIPAELCQVLGTVTKLFLQHNLFRDMTDMRRLRHLRYLNLSYNNIVEVNGVNSLNNLLALNLSYNKIAGIHVSQLPPSLQFIQLKGNPVAQDERGLFSKLAHGMPVLRQIDGRDVPISRSFSEASLAPMGSDESSQESNTNALIEAALQELELEEFEKAMQRVRVSPRADLMGRQPLRTMSQSSLKEDGLSPIRVTPATSRQASADLLVEASGDAREVIERLREALPTLREASHLGFESRISECGGSEIGNKSRARSINLEGTGYGGIRRLNSDLGRPGFRAGTMPSVLERMPASRTGSLGGSLGSQGSLIGPTFPLVHTPPDYQTSPIEFQNTLSTAVAMLIGSTGPPRHVGLTSEEQPQTIWAQAQLHRQKVLDYLFAKKPTDASKASSASGSELEPGSNPDELSRQDSTIGKHNRHRHGGSVVPEEILLSLQQRDAPRAKGLSAALQGPPAQPPSVQLALLSQDKVESEAAERLRMHLRLGIVKMLEHAQNRRELEPAAENAVLAELKKLKETRTLKNLIAREGHMPPQPQVLATILDSHSRLGSITEHLEKVLPRHISGVTPVDAQPLAAQHPPVERWRSVHQIKSSQPEVISPFAAPAPSGSAELPKPPQRSTPPSPSRLEGHEQRPRQSPFRGKEADSQDSPRTLQSAKPQRESSQRRQQIPEPPGSPGSDTEPDPPRTRQDARPIFGGIAKMIRGQSGSLEMPTFSSASRTQSSRPQSGKASTQPHHPLSRGTGMSQSARAMGASALRAGKTDSEKLSMLRAAPGTQSYKHMGISRTQSSLETKDDSRVEELRAAALEADKRDAKVKAELWERFSGRSNTVNLHTRPAGGAPQQAPAAASQKEQQQNVMLPSPFSPFSAPPAKAGSSPLVAASPFSQPGQEAGGARRQSHDSDRLPPASPQKPLTKGDMAASPFAHSHLPFISKIPPNPWQSTESRSSAPALSDAASERQGREAQDLGPDNPAANSAPPGISQAIKEAVQQVKSEKQGPYVSPFEAQNP